MNASCARCFKSATCRIVGRARNNRTVREARCEAHAPARAEIGLELLLQSGAVIRLMDIERPEPVPA